MVAVVAKFCQNRHSWQSKEIKHFIIRLSGVSHFNGMTTSFHLNDLIIPLE